MTMKLEAYEVSTQSFVSISPAPGRREWMERTPQRFASRCLPLLMANQAGWLVALNEPVEAEWSGEDGLHEVEISGSARARQNVTSHFGSGIVTFKIPYLIRTPPGYNLLVRGPANLFKDGIAPLEGLVEADWAVAPFTMNWKITRPKHRIRFEQGEPICMLVPEARGVLEQFEPAILELDDNAELAAKYRQWHKERGQFLDDLRANQQEAVRAGWQRDYFLGRGPSGEKVEEHQMKLELADFRREPKLG